MKTKTELEKRLKGIQKEKQEIEDALAYLDYIGRNSL